MSDFVEPAAIPELTPETAVIEESAIAQTPEMDVAEVSVSPETPETGAEETQPLETGAEETPETAQDSPEGEAIVHLQVHLKAEGDHLLLSLPPETEFGGSWVELSQQLQLRLSGGDRFWQANTQVHLLTRDRLVDARQLQAIADSLQEVQLKLTRVFTSRRQTAVAAATAGYCVEQTAGVTPFNRGNQDTPEPTTPLAEPLYLQTTLRSGVEIRHPGTVVILGDLNPGSSIIADGDILVWGRLRGVAHAGAKGNSKCMILALQLEATQLRIAEQVARSPQTPPTQYYPEVAYTSPEGIRISRYTDFVKTQAITAT